MQTIKKLGRILGGAILIINLIVLSGLLTIFITKVSLVNISGTSMMPALHDGSKALYAPPTDLKRYNMVLIENGSSESILVKRIIGLPGEDIAVIDGKLYIDNQLYDEPYVDPSNSEVFKTEAFRVVLGVDEYFVMGDNRDKSNPDSRVFGPVLKEMIVGRINRSLGRAGGADDIKEVGENYQKPEVEEGDSE